MTNVGLTLIATNLGMSLENIILFIIMVGCIVFFAKDFKLGVVLSFVAAACSFMLFYALEWDWSNALIVMFLCLILMAISLFFVGGVTGNSGGGIQWTFTKYSF